MNTNCLGIPHPSGPQKLQNRSCSVQFNLLIPGDLNATPYILFSSTGIHTHNAPPPRNTPQMLMDSFLIELRKLVRAGLTSSTYMLLKRFEIIFNIYSSNSAQPYYTKFSSTI
jgi:hypothetical protein